MSRLVRQRSRCDCLVASVAMYCDVPYEDVWRAWSRKHRWAMVTFGTGAYFCQAVRVIHELTGDKLFMGTVDDPGEETLGEIDTPAIISVPSTRRGTLHAVYWCDGKVYDPNGYVKRGWPPAVDSVIAPSGVFVDGDRDWHAWVEQLEPANLAAWAEGPAAAAGCLPWRNP